MGLEQLNFIDGQDPLTPTILRKPKDKIEMAIMRLQQFEPPEGYYLAFSGGKDSVVLLDLAKKAGVKSDAHYNLTTIDPPEVVQFIKTFREVKIERPEHTMCELIVKKGLPRRQGRWCCEELKERGGSGRVVLTGIRWLEAKGRTRRAHRGMVETCYRDRSKRFVHPIIDWTTDEVWQYIKDNHIRYCSLYDEGFERLGCILCPMVRNVASQIKRWPKITEALRRATYRYWERQTPGGQKFETAEDLWQWWLKRDQSRIAFQQEKMMFDSDD
tara:strand:+ start:7188 stop:8003 length:816 start_codon:yes stop_codon:yes gene_type:complete